MRLVLEDSRRLTGPNLLSPGPGAILDVRAGERDAGALSEAWERRAREVLRLVGWGAEETCLRRHRHGVSLALTAPVDALYAATEVAEWALAAAAADVEGGEPEESAALAAERLRALIDAESNPALLRLRAAAAGRGLTFLSDDEVASVGTGCGSLAWPVDELPRPADVPWHEIRDVPIALVTGTNGKTTTVRLLAAMVAETGRVPGLSSTDGVVVDGELVERGDFSGPGGARAALRDRRVEVAVLETARGGMLRRGLGVPAADAAAVTNVGVDHLGEHGLHDIEAIADAKLVIARAVEGGGRLVLNADDDVLARRAAPGAAALVWFARSPASGRVAGHLASGGEAVVVERGSFVRRRGAGRHVLLRVVDAPITLGGAAEHNVENALAALALAPAVAVDDEAAARALAGFRPTADRLPGRTNLFRFGAATVLVDFVHNPHGMDALAAAALRLPARRRLVVLGQAGDRDDESIRALVRSACRMRPDRVVVKELAPYLRGRQPGEVPRVIREELTALAPDIEVVDAADDLAAARSALEWCGDADLLILAVQAQREEVIGLLERLVAVAWQPGSPLLP